MAVLSCFALFLCRPDGRVSLQGYKKQENHNFTSSAAGTKCKTTAPGMWSITAVDTALAINLSDISLVYLGHKMGISWAIGNSFWNF